MKNVLAILLIFMSLNVFSQEEPSYWNVQPDHRLELNYGMFGKSYIRGVGIGALGYAAGMYISGNRTGWGLAGSLIAVNLPILLDKDYDQTEKVIGYNAGALTISVGMKILIDWHRKEDKPTYKIEQWLRKR